MGEVSNRLKVLLSSIASVAGALALCSSAAAGVAQPGDTFPISYLTPPAGSVPGSMSGTMGPGYAAGPASTDGRYVFFTSESDNLVAGTGLEENNVFRKDRQTGDVVLINREDGAQGAIFGGYFYSFETSADGNLVAIVTDHKATPADTDAETDLYLRNISAGTTTLLTPGTTESVYDGDISANGAYAVFSTNQSLAAGDGNGDYDVYRVRISDGTFTLVSARNGLATAGNSQSESGSISNDGTWVAFVSEATNLVAGFTDGNGPSGGDVYVRNVDSNNTYLVSSKYNAAATGGDDDSEEPQIAGAPAAIGDVNVAYTSYATNLADNATTDTSDSASVYLKDMPNVPSELISRATGASGANADSRAHTPSISDDASRVVFSSDAENLGAGKSYYGVYLRDRTSSATSLVSARNEYAIEGQVSGDGSTATWNEAGATPDSDPDLAAIFARSLPDGATDLVSRPKGNAAVRAAGFTAYDSGDRSLSANGRYYVFSTNTRRLPGASTPDGSQGASSVYRRDLKTGDIELVSRASGADGAIAKGGTGPSISSDGNLVAYTAYGSLDPADPNEEADIYVRNMTTKVTSLVSRGDGAAGPAADEQSGQAEISGDGTRVAFVSNATNLGAPGGHPNVFLRDIVAGKTYVVSRASTEAGDVANAEAKEPSVSFNGSRVLFESYATNLHPDDPLNNYSIFVRDLSSNETQLVTREPGLTGNALVNYSHSGTISRNGGTVAFVTYDQVTVPDSGTWPLGVYQVVVRTLADGTNRLASVSSGGLVGDDYSSGPSLSRDGNIIAFQSSADNLRDDIGPGSSQDVVVRDMSNGTITGPLAFGLTPDSGYVQYPGVSDNGECVSFSAIGHNAVSGDLGDIQSQYMYARGGNCVDPQALVPALTAVSLKPAKFRVSPKPTARVSARKKKAPRGTKIRFTLNIPATVTIQIDRKLPGRKAGKKCVKPTRKNKRKKACVRYVKVGKLTRKNQAAGKRVVPFSGRIGKKKLKPGRYRVVLQGTSQSGKSAGVYRSFKIVR